MDALKKLSIYHYILYICFAILLLCGLTHILSSCNDGFESRWNQVYGKEVMVKVSVGITGFGEDIDVTRSAGVPTPLTATAPLGDGLVLQATLEPDTAQSRTRAGPLIPFPEDTHIRVVAYPLGSTTPAGHAFVDADGIALAANDTIRLAAGDYRFVAYAYYHPNYRDVPDGYETSIENKVPDIVVAFPLEKDVLYGSTIKYVGPDSLAKIDVVHLYSRITREEANTTQMGSGHPVQTISNVVINNYNGNLHLAKDSLSRGAAAPHSISNSLWSSVPAVTCSAADTFLVYPAGGTMVNIGTVQVDGRTFNNVSTTFNTELERGVSYKLKLNIKSESLPGDDDPISDFPYVGAFWRAQEKGERVIHIPVTGLSPQDTAWTATVWHDLSRWTPGSDGVVLAMGDSPDPNIRQSGFNPNAENYPVSPGSTNINGVISGGHITFRIGLQQYLPSATSPPRYAVALIYFGPNKSLVRRIFLRQGEEPDYLMRPNDPNGTGAAVADGRSYARKFSPYNLKDPANNTAIGYGNVTDLGYRGGAPVGFPSQAGYFFHWNFNTKAFLPANPATLMWNASIGYGAAYWDHSANEVCPSDYRRPQDGTSHNTAGAVAGSEIRQSLWLNPVAGGMYSSGTVSNTDNTVFGYYADGFFDRREIVTPAVGSGILRPLSTVVTADAYEAAYNGQLFFNPYNNASLFFPVSGFRDASQGELMRTGDYAHYWTSSSQDASYAWTFTAGYTSAGSGSIDKVAGFSVRCVKDDCPAVAGVTVSPNTTQYKLINRVGMQGGQTITFTATAANATLYQWYVDGSLVQTGPSNTYTFTAPLTALNVRPESYSISVRAANSCTTTPAQSTPVTVTVLKEGWVRSTLAAAPYYGWIRFDYNNWGANTTMSLDDQMAYSPSGVTDATVFGDAYQWGRRLDGHEKRNSLCWPLSTICGNDIPYGTCGDVPPDPSGQVPDTSPAYTRFIRCNNGSPLDWRTTQSTTLWNTGTDASPVKNTNGSDPCPSGWRVPTRTEWQSIFDGGTVNSTGFTNTSGNYLKWNTSGTVSGWKFSPAGSDGNYTFFLPAGGYRDNNSSSFKYVGGALGAGEVPLGLYWSSATTGIWAYYTDFAQTGINTSATAARTGGFTLRCVAQSY